MPQYESEDVRMVRSSDLRQRARNFDNLIEWHNLEKKFGALRSERCYSDDLTVRRAA
jgi:hypothetical protein